MLTAMCEKIYYIYFFTGQYYQEKKNKKTKKNSSSGALWFMSVLITVRACCCLCFIFRNGLTVNIFLLAFKNRKIHTFFFKTLSFKTLNHYWAVCINRMGQNFMANLRQARVKGWLYASEAEASGRRQSLIFLSVQSFILLEIFSE